MKWNFKFASQNEELLFVTLCIVIGLLFLAAIRILLLLRRVSIMHNRADKLEKQILDQQRIILDIRSDSNAWRGEMQRQFDAFRAESTRWRGEQELGKLEITT
jgi:hypothetical protein